MIELKQVTSKWKSLEKFQKVELMLSAGILLFLAICCWALCETIVPIYIDDVMYGSWTDRDLSYFFEMNWWHINNFNGRTFIHLMLQLVLIFGEHLYAIIMPIMLIAIFAIFAKLINKNLSTAHTMLVSSAGLAMFLALNHTYLAPTMLWMSGGFNYIFPLFFIAITYWLFLKTKDTKFSILTCLLVLLSGATTEQYGMYTIGLIAMTILYEIIDKKFQPRNLVYLAMSILGYISIIFSPSTFGRLTNSNQYTDTIQMSFIDGYYNNFSFFGGAFGLPLFIIIFMVAMGMLGLIKSKETNERKYNKYLIISIPVALISVILVLFGFTNIFGLITFAYFAFIAVLFGMNKQTRELSKLAVCGFGSFFMMSITMAAGTRTCLPCILSMIILISFAIYEICKNMPKFTKIVALALVATSFITVFFPLYNGYKEKEPFSRDVYNQFANVNETKEIVIDFDETLSSPTAKYRYPTVFDGCILGNQEKFNEAFNIPEDTKYTFKSKKHNVSSLMYGNKYLSMPAITIDEEVYVPLLFGTIIEKYENHAPQGYVSIINEGVEFKFYRDGRIVRSVGDNETLVAENIEYQIISQYGGVNRFISLETLCDIMQLMYQYDEDQNTYKVSYNHILILEGQEIT